MIDCRCIMEIRVFSKSATSSNRISITTLNTRNLQAHIEDILKDQGLISNMILCFPETRTDFSPNRNKFSKLNFNTSYFIHGVLSCIDTNIDILATKNFCNDKVELVMSELYIQQHVRIMNIYSAPFSSATMIVDTISIAKKQMLHIDNILLIIGDFNIDIHAIFKEVYI